MHPLFKKTCLKLAIIVGLCLSVYANTSGTANAATEKHQFQLDMGPGVFVGTDHLDASFDFNLETEYFITQHISASFRFDVTAGGLDAAHLSARFRYYFDIPNHTKWNIYLGAGAGGIIGFHGGGLGDFALPVFGFQYDLTDHIKIGSDVSFDIVFNDNNAAFAARLMPLQFKWAF